MNIILVGYRGAGKTSVGKYIAKQLKRQFIDCDDYIEKKTHLTIKEIFELSGEAYFRDLESTAIAEISKLNGVIVATGGGAILRYKNTQNLKRNGLVFFLDVDYESAYERIIRDAETSQKRPRLTTNSLLEEIKQQITSRYPYYQQAADHIVSTINTLTEDIAEKIIRIISEHEDTTHIEL